MGQVQTYDYEKYTNTDWLWRKQEKLDEKSNNFNFTI